MRKSVVDVPQCLRAAPVRSFIAPDGVTAVSAPSKTDIVKILDEADDMTIATVREDVYPQATTVSFVNDGLNIYFGAGGKSQKAQNIARCNKVSITVNLPYKSWDQIKGVSLAGIARRITDANEMARVGQLMFAKFPQVAKYAPPDPQGMALYCVSPKVVSVLDYTQGFGHTDLVNV